MASTMKVTFAAGAELGMRCLTNIEYGICLSCGSEPSSCTRVKGMALKWGRGTQHPKAQRWEKKTRPNRLLAKNRHFTNDPGRLCKRPCGCCKRNLSIFLTAFSSGSPR